MSGQPKSAQIEALIEEFQRSGLRELHVRADGIELFLSNDPESAGVAEFREGADVRPGKAKTTAGSASAAAPEGPDQAHDFDGATVVKAPYLGTFYRAPKPGAPHYVEVGDLVEADTELCLVEVMKLFTAVRADVRGRIVAVLADDGALVSAGQPLFAIEVD